MLRIVDAFKMSLDVLKKTSGYQKVMMNIENLIISQKNVSQKNMFDLYTSSPTTKSFYVNLNNKIPKSEILVILFSFQDILIFDATSQFQI